MTVPYRQEARQQAFTTTQTKTPTTSTNKKIKKDTYNTNSARGQIRFHDQQNIVSSCADTHRGLVGKATRPKSTVLTPEIIKKGHLCTQVMWKNPPQQGDHIAALVTLEQRWNCSIHSTVARDTFKSQDQIPMLKTLLKRCQISTR